MRPARRQPVRGRHNGTAARLPHTRGGRCAARRALDRTPVARAPRGADTEDDLEPAINRRLPRRNHADTSGALKPLRSRRSGQQSTAPPYLTNATDRARNVDRFLATRLPAAAWQRYTFGRSARRSSFAMGWRLRPLPPRRTGQHVPRTLRPDGRGRRIRACARFWQVSAPPVRATLGVKELRRRYRRRPGPESKFQAAFHPNLHAAAPLIHHILDGQLTDLRR